MITANRRENGFRCTNGEIVTVSNIDHERRITLTDGRILPLGFRQFTHGYAVTAHRSQGKSVDEVIISGDGMRKELFYVAASRGRESVQIITSDKELLRESVGLSNARQSASELERSKSTGTSPGNESRPCIGPQPCAPGSSIHIAAGKTACVGKRVATSTYCGE